MYMDIAVILDFTTLPGRVSSLFVKRFTGRENREKAKGVPADYGEARGGGRGKNRAGKVECAGKAWRGGETGNMPKKAVLAWQRGAGVGR